MATTPTTPAVGNSAQQTLSEWAGPYVTDMLGKAQAVSDQPYQVYQGPMTAGESGLQSNVFQGLGNLNFPSNLGQSFSSPMGAFNQQPPAFNPATMQSNLSGAPTQGLGSLTNQLANNLGSQLNQGDMNQPTLGLNPQQLADSANTSYAGQTGMPQGIAGLQAPQATQQPSNIAQSYMNPYLQSVLDPQLAELRRQNDITNMNTNAKMTQAGAFGGGRQAIMNAENNRNMMQEMNKTVGQGYSNAYDKAMGQFNTEQGQAKTLADMMGQYGAQQRGIEQEGITADYNEFLAQRDYPQKQLQFQQSMLQGLPISTVSNQPASLSGIGQLSSTVGGLGNLMTALKNLGLKD